MPASQLHPLTMGDSSAVQVGDSVIAIGSPFGLPNTVTAGIVSAVGRTINAPNQFTIPNAIQTDAPINPGNSGGPLLNAAGQVIGLNDQIETNNTNGQGEGSSSGVGFATPSNSDARIAREIIATGQAHNAYVGVSLDPTVTGGAAVAKNSSTAGAAPIVPGSPAAKAGLQAGDLITAVNGTPVASVNQFVADDRQLRARRHRDPDRQPRRAEQEHQADARRPAGERHHPEPAGQGGRLGTP